MYRDSIKWQLIESKLMEEFKLEDSKEEIKTYYKEALISNYFPKAENETEEQAKEREEAIEKMRKKEEHFLFATLQLAREGLDIKPLNRLFLIAPSKNKRSINSISWKNRKKR
jgi:hypothetical protein